MALLIGTACQAGEPGGSPPSNPSPDSSLARSHPGQADAIVNVPRVGTGIVGKMTPLRTSTAAEPPSITVVGELENGLKSRGAQDRGPFGGIGDLASNGSNQQSLVTLDTGRLAIALFVLALLAAVGASQQLLAGSRGTLPDLGAPETSMKKLGLPIQSGLIYELMRGGV